MENLDQIAHLSIKSYKLANAPIDYLVQTTHPRRKRCRLANATIEDLDHTAYTRSNSYKLSYVPFEYSDQTAHPLNKRHRFCHKTPPKTQISLHIPTAKFTILPYAPIKDSDQTANCAPKVTS